MAKLLQGLLKRKEVAMATRPNRLATALDSLKTFTKNVITSFGFVVILKAAMAPHALRHIVC